MSAPLDRITCEAAFRRLDDYLDRQLDADEMRLVEEHLRLCAACTREFTFEASVIAGVRRKLRAIEAPADLLARITSELRRASGAADAE
jgi:anti-sigma factor (TIGR02949 family)